MDIFTKLKILMSVFMFTNFSKQNVTLHFNFLCFYDKNLVVIRHLSFKTWGSIDFFLYASQLN